MSERTALITRVYTVSEKLNIEKTLTDRIIKAYLEFCKNELICGHRVNFCGIALIVPKYEEFNYKTTFAYKCSKIAESNALPYNTVLQVVLEYIGTIKDDIFNGRPANIYGLITLTPLYENGVVTRIHASISQSLQEYLRGYGTHARASTTKVFKRKVKEACISDRKNT